MSLSLQSAKVNVLVNDIHGLKISCRRGLCLGDPLSPLIFVLVTNGLHHMITKCRNAGLISGLGCRHDTNSIINLHYAADILICRKECMPRVLSLKWILFFYENGLDSRLIITIAL